MLIITYKDSTQKMFSLSKSGREQTFRNMWVWCSKHVPEKKLKVKTENDEIFVVAMGDLTHVEII
jgi:hypothetical protein